MDLGAAVWHSGRALGLWKQVALGVYSDSVPSYSYSWDKLLNFLGLGFRIYKTLNTANA